MGYAIWVDVQGRAEDDLPQDIAIMLLLKRELDALSEKLRVPRLTEFYDYSALEEAYAGLMDEDEAVEDSDSGEASGGGQSKGSWFDPAPALAAVRALHDHLVEHPGDLPFKPDASRRHWPADLMKELQHCQAVLEEAASRGRQFRFLIMT
jgi:hypothetical protein